MSVPTKILLIGNSYTYYNGYGEIISKLGKLTKEDLIVVRATKGKLSANQLLFDKLEYKAWRNGTVITKGTDKLQDIINIDFGNLKRAGKWDYIFLQNNATVEATYSGDVAAFNYCKTKISKPTNFIINVTHFGNSLSDNRLKEHKRAAAKCGCSLIDVKDYYAKYNTEISKWQNDLTILDSNYHASARGMYINALCAFAKIYGLSKFPKSSTDNTFISLYNSDKGNAKEFITDNYKAGKYSNANTVTKSVAKRLQYLVYKYAKTYIGNNLYQITAMAENTQKDVKTMSKTYFGIDISEHNGTVDWEKVSKNVDFAILRICWVGNNSNKMDVNFEKNYAAARKAGIKLGAYVYMYSQSTTAAEKGATWVLSQIKGKTFELPIYCDMEDPTLQGFSAQALTAITDAFNAKIKSGGYKTGIYANLSWFNNKLNKSVRSYHTWIAHYTTGTNKYKGEYEMWQNSSKGKVSGVNGNVDTNYLYEDIFSGSVSQTVKPTTQTYAKWTGYVTANSLNVREKPNTDCKVLGIVKTGTAFKIEGESGDFYKTTYNKTTAYVSKKYISKTKPVTQTVTYSKWTGYVTANTLNVRAKASTDSDILGTLANGKSVTIEGESGKFYKITFNKKTAYVSKDYISKTKPIASWTGMVTAKKLNVREKASTTAKILGTLKKGETVKITGESGKFYKTTYKSQTAFVYKSYIKKK